MYAAVDQHPPGLPAPSDGDSKRIAETDVVHPYFDGSGAGLGSGGHRVAA
jgi:hypothetical protein